MSLVEARALALPGRLQATDLALEAGSVTCLIGPNGSGKTSLLHALARIGGAAGAVRIGGMDPAREGPALRSRLLAYLPATRDIHWPLTARDVVALSGAGEEEVDAAIDRLDLAPFADRRLDRLSTGERSRVLIARAIATRPALLLLDEPSANLDPLWRIRLADLIRSEVETGGRAALVAMHDLDAAAAVADRLIVMEGGRIAADGLPDAILGASVIRDVFGIERSARGWRAAPQP